MPDCGRPSRARGSPWLLEAPQAATSYLVSGSHERGDDRPRLRVPRREVACEAILLASVEPSGIRHPRTHLSVGLEHALCAGSKRQRDVVHASSSPNHRLRTLVCVVCLAPNHRQLRGAQTQTGDELPPIDPNHTVQCFEHARRWRNLPSSPTRFVRRNTLKQTVCHADLLTLVPKNGVLFEGRHEDMCWLDSASPPKVRDDARAGNKRPHAIRKKSIHGVVFRLPTTGLPKARLLMNSLARIAA